MISAPLPAFVDVEASGLATGSWPIEIGIALPTPVGPDEWTIELASWLIRPPRAWHDDPETWQAAAEAIHGVPLARLFAEGLPPQEVAGALDVAIGNRPLVSDTGAAGFDAHWLGLLAAAAGEPWASRGWTLSPLRAEEWIANAARKTGLSGARALMLRQTAPTATHAAAEDAVRLTWMWCDAASANVPRRTISATSSYRQRHP
jgi:hypothetical protein